MKQLNDCPCCGSKTSLNICKECGHSWHIFDTQSSATNYSNLSGRNSLPQRYVRRKLDDRISSLHSHIRSGMHILEIGCAEGNLGARIKNTYALTYWGVEPSQDAELAQQHLDAVFCNSDEVLQTAKQFDGILSFHVLEHILDPKEEVLRWRALSHEKSWLMIEVPCRAGHADIQFDKNQEHIHHFSPASLTLLLERCGFDSLVLTRGHYESAVYTDSLRILAIPKPPPETQHERLIKRFSRIPGPFAIFGLGGDFRNYLQPIINQLPIATLFDNNPLLLNTLQDGIKIERYTPLVHNHLPILICSLRYEESILDQLNSTGHPRDLVYLLSDIYDDMAQS